MWELTFNWTVFAVETSAWIETRQWASVARHVHQMRTKRLHVFPVELSLLAVPELLLLFLLRRLLALHLALLLLVVLQLTCWLLRHLLPWRYLNYWAWELLLLVFLRAVVNVRGLSFLLAVWTSDISIPVHIFGRLHYHTQNRDLTELNLTVLN